MKRLKHPINISKISLPLICVFVGNFFIQASFCQINNGDIVANPSSEAEKLNVLAARDKEINSLLSKAISLYKQKQIEEAINLFEQVIRLDSQNASAHFSLGIALEAKHDVVGAMNHYASAHEIDPGNNDYQKAFLNLKDKIEKEKADQLEVAKEQAIASQAADAFKRGQYEQSLSLYETLDKQNPHLAFAKYNIGTLYMIQKKHDEALKYYKAANKLEPKNEQYAESFKKLKENLKQVQNVQNNEKKNNKVQGQNVSGQNINEQKKLADQAAQKNILTYCGLRIKSAKEGVLIEAILTGSRAAQVGLKPGDIIKVVDGQAVKKATRLEKILQSKPLGQRFQFLVLRGGQTGVILF